MEMATDFFKISFFLFNLSQDFMKVFIEC